MASLVTAIIKRSRLTPVREALDSIGVTGLTVYEVNGYGRQGGQTETYRGVEYKLDFVQKTRLDMVVPTDKVEQVLDTVAEAARTGNIGDGKMWVVDLARVVRIRTGEEGESAI